MDVTDDCILSVLGSANRQVSLKFLFQQVNQKAPVAYEEFQARILDLQGRGYLRAQRVGRNAVLVSLTQAGAEHLPQVRNQPAPVSDRVLSLAALFIVLLVCGVSILALPAMTGWAKSSLLSEQTAVLPEKLVPDTGWKAAHTQPLAPTLTLTLAPTETPTLVPTATDTPTLEPTATAAFTPVPTDIPTLAPQFVLQAEALKGLNGLNVAETVLLPVIDPMYRSAENGFNQVVQSYAGSTLNITRDELGQPVPGVGGFLKIDYLLVSAEGWAPGEHFPYFDESTNGIPLSSATMNGGREVISVIFSKTTFSGGAHPSTRFETVNYDLSSGRYLRLDDLFFAGSPYLDVISSYCRQNLPLKADYLLDSIKAGTAPLPENYQVWAITRSGLLIVFQEYQVAPYAAGPQFVLVPFEYLGQLIDPRGPLEQFAQ